MPKPIDFEHGQIQFQSRGTVRPFPRLRPIGGIGIEPMIGAIQDIKPEVLDDTQKKSTIELIREGAQLVTDFFRVGGVTSGLGRRLFVIGIDNIAPQVGDYDKFQAELNQAVYMMLWGGDAKRRYGFDIDQLGLHPSSCMYFVTREADKSLYYRETPGTVVFGLKRRERYGIFAEKSTNQIEIGLAAEINRMQPSAERRIISSNAIIRQTFYDLATQNRELAKLEAEAKVVTKREEYISRLPIHDKRVSFLGRLIDRLIQTLMARSN